MMNDFKDESKKEMCIRDSCKAPLMNTIQGDKAAIVVNLSLIHICISCND